MLSAILLSFPTHAGSSLLGHMGWPGSKLGWPRRQDTALCFICTIQAGKPAALLYILRCPLTAVTHKKGFQSALNTYRIVSMISWAASWCLSWNKANKQVFSEMTGVLCFRRLQKLQSCSWYMWQAHKGRSIWLPPEPLNQSKWDHYFGCLLNRTRNTHHKSLQGRAPKAHAVHVDAPCYEKKSYLGKMKVFYISCCSHHKKP